MSNIKDRIKRVVGLPPYHSLTDHELERIAKLLRAVPKSDRSVGRLQSIVRQVTGYETFSVKESLDNSDLDNLIDQIIQTLDN